MTGLKDRTGFGESAGGWVHFAVAAGILAVTAFGFEYTIAALELVTQKKAVPWPEKPFRVIVNPDTFRWENLPERVGNRYFLVEDGELNGEKDGVPDGEIVIKDDVLESLRIGSSLDEKRVGSRCSNWLSLRVYRDNTKPRGHPLRYWRLDVYYYTGGLDTVPHVPEACLQAAGATPLPSGTISFNVPAAQSPWGDGPLSFRRARFEVPDVRTSGTRQVVEYYIFSVNGEPEDSRNRVRLKLMDPFEPYSYFAKIQFGCLGQPSSDKELDAAAEDFMNYMLPVIVRAFPTAEFIEKLKSAEKEAE